MPKLAQLHTGEVLEFPDDASDGIMDRAVRQHLGLPEPTDFDEENLALRQQQVAAVANVGARIEALEMVLASVEQKLDVLPAIADSGVKEAVEGLGARLDVLANVVLTALTADKVLIKDNNGNPTGVKVVL